MVFTTLESEESAAFKIASMFSQHFLVFSAIEPSIKTPSEVRWTWPEQ